METQLPKDDASRFAALVVRCSVKEWEGCFSTDPLGKVRSPRFLLIRFIPVARRYSLHVFDDFPLNLTILVM